jgi:hypothetical protein
VRFVTAAEVPTQLTATEATSAHMKIEMPIPSPTSSTPEGSVRPGRDVVGPGGNVDAFRDRRRGRCDRRLDRSSVIRRSVADSPKARDRSSAHLGDEQRPVAGVAREPAVRLEDPRRRGHATTTLPAASHQNPLSHWVPGPVVVTTAPVDVSTRTPSPVCTNAT